VDPMESIQLPSMNHLYNDRTLFVTGASGLLGKVMIEKMLYSLPSIKRIYILVRASKGKSAAERWKDIENSVLFNRIRRECPDRLMKVVPFEGDVSLPNLGISQEDLKRLLEETSMVFHCAATVRFDEPLKRAVEVNVNGVSRVLSLCNRMPKLESLLHCSTCFSNSDRRGTIIEEKIYTQPCDPRKLMEAKEWMTDAVYESIGEGACKTFGNTYCFTKRLAEHLVMNEAANLPALIFRPAIVSGVWKDGIPGWCDVFQGISTFLTTMGTGVLTRVPFGLDARLDMIPVDIVSSAMIVCAAYRINLQSKSIPIIHCNTGTVNPAIFKRIRSPSLEVAFKYPFIQTMGTPVFSHMGDDRLEKTMHQIREKYLGPFIDNFLMLFGKKPFYGRLYGRVSEAYHIFARFLTGYSFKMENLILLLNMMTDEDKEIFEFDVRKIDWNNYCADIWFGVKVFLMKDDIVNRSNVALARRNIMLHQTKDFITTFLLCFFGCFAITGSATTWQLFVPLTLIIHYYFSVPSYKARMRPSIETYKKRVESAAGESIESLQRKK
ncbi:hypothetical protein PMAYCL1PPCAC_30623, partial [Pristionchus mayeri]